MPSFDAERIEGVIRREAANLILMHEADSRGKGKVDSLEEIVDWVRERLTRRPLGISDAMSLAPGFPSVARVVRDFLEESSIRPGEWLTDSGRAICVAARDAWLERFGRGDLSFSLLAGLAELTVSSRTGRVAALACGFGSPEMALSSRVRHSAYAESQIFDGEWDARCVSPIAPTRLQAVIGKFAAMSGTDSISALFVRNWLDMFQIHVDYRQVKEEIATGTDGDERRDLTAAVECDMFESFPACDLQKCVLAVLGSDLPSVKAAMRSVSDDTDRKIAYGISFCGKRGIVDIRECAKFESQVVERRLAVISAGDINPDAVRGAVSRNPGVKADDVPERVGMAS